MADLLNNATDSVVAAADSALEAAGNIARKFENPLNTEFVSSVVGFDFNDLQNKVKDPFGTQFDIAWVATATLFVLTVLVFFASTIAFSFCDCLDDCCCGPSKKRRNRVNSSEQVEMSGRKA